jgi:hypothetical protein
VDNFAGMADSGVPFPVDASSVALVEDYVDLPAGVQARIDLLLTDLIDGDVVGSAVLVIKESPDASNLANTTIIKTITSTLSADGVITATDDANVRRATFLLLARETVRLSVRSTYTYTVSATITRDGVTFTRIVQRGAIAATGFAMEDDSPLADGAYLADGSLFATGFAT